MTGEGLLWERLNALYSVVMVLDRDLRIVRASDTLQRHLPAVSDAPRLTELFEFKRPSAVATFEDLQRQAQTLFLMVTRDASFALRGQVADLDGDDSSQVYFLGSPWLS